MIFSRLVFRCICAVSLGVAVMAVFAALLIMYGEAQETYTQVTTARAIKFPENEKMLNDVANQLAREGEALSKVEPAAGQKNQ